MRSFTLFLFGWCCTALLISCSKDDSISPPPPPETTPVISNLDYGPSKFTIIPTLPIRVLSTKFSYYNASGGVASIHFSSPGINIARQIHSNTSNGGLLSEEFNLYMPSTPGIITFEIWILDNKGNASNKLTGNFELIIDDSGNNWTDLAEVPQEWRLFKVAWLSNQFIAIGKDGIIVSSQGSRVWSKNESGTTADLRGICYGSYKYAVVGNNSAVLYSRDGYTWNPGILREKRINLNAVACNDNRFIAIGYKQETNEAIMIKSTDGINWEIHEWNAPNTKLYNIIWANKKFIVVGEDDHPFTMFSADGITWEDKHSFTGGKGKLLDVIWNDSMYVTVGYDIAATSTDGENWNYRSTGIALSGIAWSGNFFIAVGGSGIYRSTNGLDWTMCFNTSPYIPPNSIAWSGINYVAVGSASPVIIVSPSH